LLIPDARCRQDLTAAWSLKLYGLDGGTTKRFGTLCLTARRLVERGVRFVQVYHGDGQGSRWDAHAHLSGCCSQAPITGRPEAGVVSVLL
jgi:hypothetical protein